MFDTYRMRRLKTKTEVQKALVDKLEIAEKEYGSGYYTNKLHDAVCKLVELRSKLKWLEDRQAN